MNSETALTLLTEFTNQLATKTNKDDIITEVSGFVSVVAVQPEYDADGAALKTMCIRSAIEYSVAIITRMEAEAGKRINPDFIMKRFTEVN